MDLAWVLFGLLVAMCAVMGVAFFVEEVPFSTGEDGSKTYLGHGVQHDEYKSMLAGGPGAERHEKILWVGWAFGALQCVFFTCCLAFGARKNGKLGKMLRPILVGGVVYVAVFTAMVYSYSRFVERGADIPLFLSFPRPTAWMMYGVWGAPLFYLVLYLVTFDKWVWRDEDLTAFKQIVAQRSSRSATGEESA